MTQAIKAFLEADALRTQGEWTWRNPNLRSFGDAHVDCEAAEKVAVCGQISAKTDWGYLGRCEPEQVEANAAFIAAASRIAPDLTKMVDDMRVAKEALEEINAWGLAPECRSSGQSGIKERSRVWTVLGSALTRLKPYEKLFEKEGE